MANYTVMLKEQEEDSKKEFVTTLLETDNYKEAVGAMLLNDNSVIVYSKDVIKQINNIRLLEGVSAIEAINTVNNCNVLRGKYHD